jgi:hypothetical protein
LRSAPTNAELAGESSTVSSAPVVTFRCKKSATGTAIF